MARQSAINIENNFTRGLITENTGLNFPENAMTEGYNVVIKENTKTIRRLGLDYETSYALKTGVANTIDGLDDIAITEYLWRNASNQGFSVFQVVQVGATLYFYEGTEGDSLSANIKAFTVDLQTFEFAGVVTGCEFVECQYATGDGKLFVCSPSIDPFYVTYSVSGDTISTTEIAVKIRDTVGLDDGFDIDERVAAASQTVQHQYNLYNQGWLQTALLSGGAAASAYSHWDTARTDFPSNADVWWRFRRVAEKAGTPDNALYLTLVDTEATGNTPAPRGYFLLDAFFQDRDAASGLAGITDVNAATRPTCIAFFAGRVWYSGVNAVGFGSNLYFSQIAEDPTQYGKCYQKLDPTSEDFSDLLPSDGGVVVIPEVGSVKKLLVFENSLLVFATNGIWSIAGSEGVGFRANDYTVNKVSAVEAVDFKSFVEFDNVPVWWNYDGIWTLQQDPQTRRITAISLSDQTIRSLLKNIPSTNIPYVKGAYNSSTKIGQWLFRSSAPSDTDDNYRYDRILCLNRVLNAFYLYSFSPISAANGPYISGITVVKGQGVTRNEIPVTDSSAAVTDGGLPVYVTNFLSTALPSTFKYLTLEYDDGVDTEWDMTWSEEKDTTYVDWETPGTGVNYDSYFFVGYKVHGQAIRKFQNNYIRVFMEQETDASLYLSMYWDYAISASSGKVSSSQQCYIDKSSYGIVSRRLRPRGSGIALQLKFVSEDGKPFTILGWSGFETANNLP